MGVNAGFHLHRIRVSSADIAEVVGTTALVSIPRAEVRKLRVERRVIAERPAVLGLFGLAATMLGVLALLYILRTTFSDAGHHVSVRLRYSQWLGLIFLVIGPGTIWHAFRKGIVLVVETTRSTRKLGFGAKVSSDELAWFADDARASGLDVEVNAELPRAVVHTR